jgi:predicted membrane chloride channel (bestrophin family)
MLYIKCNIFMASVLVPKFVYSFSVLFPFGFVVNLEWETHPILQFTPCQREKWTKNFSILV